MTFGLLSSCSVIFIFFLKVGSFSTGAAVAIIECRNDTHNTTFLASGEFISPGYLQGRNYPPNLYCSLRIEVPKGQYILISVLDIDIDRQSQCAGDSLTLTEPSTGSSVAILCQSTPPIDYISLENLMDIKFITDNFRSGRGFRIKWDIAYHRSLCGWRNFQCLDRNCVPFNAKCNGVFDCPDASDELKCEKPIIVKPPPCGRTPVKPELTSSDRIVGGKEAVPGSWPWQVEISQKQYGKAAGHFCGGSLINDRWVVTAAHCFLEKTEHTDYIQIRIGAHRLLEEEANEHIRYIERVLLHPNMTSQNGTDFRFDIALIQLSMPVNFSDSVQPVCLPTTSTAEVNQTCFMTGWGSTKGSGSDTNLKQASLTVRNFSVCKDPAVKPVEEKFQLCANNDKDGAGPCHGDSGGPFVCQNKDGTWALQGITSFGAASNTISPVCGAYAPSIWNRVSAHVEWIKDTIDIYSD